MSTSFHITFYNFKIVEADFVDFVSFYFIRVFFYLYFRVSWMFTFELYQFFFEIQIIGMNWPAKFYHLNNFSALWKFSFFFYLFFLTKRYTWEKHSHLETKHLTYVFSWSLAIEFQTGRQMLALWQDHRETHHNHFVHNKKRKSVD